MEGWHVNTWASRGMGAAFMSWPPRITWLGIKTIIERQKLSIPGFKLTEGLDLNMVILQSPEVLDTSGNSLLTNQVLLCRTVPPHNVGTEEKRYAQMGNHVISHVMGV